MSAPRFAFGLFLVSAGLLGYEFLLMRLLSLALWGHFAGFVISMSFLIGGCIVITLGHDTAGGTIATTAVLTTVFIYGTKQRRAEREEKGVGQKA